MKTKLYSSFGEVILESKKAEELVDKMNKLASNGKFFSVKFLKKDGTIRQMTARTNVTKVLNGGERVLPKNYLCVYDMKKKSYRSINPETLLEVNGISID